MTLFELTPDMLTGLPVSGPTDPLKYYRHPLVGKTYLDRINRGLRMLPAKRYERSLEVGYGAGAVLVALANGVEELHGIDLDADPEILSKYFGELKLKAHLERGTVYDMPYASGFFDLVVSFSVFEHLQEYARGLREVHRVLKPGGLFLLGLPAVNKLMEAGIFAIGYKGINDLHITKPADVAREFSAIGFERAGENMLDFPLRAPFGLRLYNNWLLRKL